MLRLPKPDWHVWRRRSPAATAPAEAAPSRARRAATHTRAAAPKAAALTGTAAVPLAGAAPLTPAPPIPTSRGARILLAAGVCAYTGFYLYWALWMHYEFGTFGYDVGIHDQALWLISRGEHSFLTISGQEYFGDHLYWISLLLVPFYWIVPGPEFLLTAQTLALGLAAIPLFLVARLVLRSERLACALAWVYFLNPYLGWANLDEFHPDVFAVPLTFLAFLFALRKRWRPFLVMVVLLLLVKEDVPLLILGIGVWVAVLHDRWTGIRTALIAVFWFFLSFRVLLPAMGGEGSLIDYVSMHGQRIPFGGVGGFLKTLVTRPWRVVAAAFTGGRAMYYLQVVGPLGFLPFLSPSTFVAVILPLAFNGLSTFVYQHNIEYHYGALVIPGLLVAAVLGIGHGSKKVRRMMIAFMLVTSMVGLYLWGPVPGSRNEGSWSSFPEEQHQAVDEALALIPDDAAVSADLRLVTRLSHRREVYEFPNPWYLVNWGDAGSNGKSLPGRAAQVQYLLLVHGMDDQSQRVFKQIEESGEFEMVFERDPVMLLKRVGPPSVSGTYQTSLPVGEPQWSSLGR